MEKTTIFDYARMCKTVGDCAGCPMSLSNNGTNEFCSTLLQYHTDKANEIILKWCKEHPVETRQDRFLKMFSNARKYGDGILSICPQYTNTDFSCQEAEKCCNDCCKDYWLTEVDENDTK